MSYLLFGFCSRGEANSSNKHSGLTAVQMFTTIENSVLPIRFRSIVDIGHCSLCFFFFFNVLGSSASILSSGVERRNTGVKNKRDIDAVEKNVLY